MSEPQKEQDGTATPAQDALPAAAADKSAEPAGLAGAGQPDAAVKDEAKLIRRLQIMMNMVMGVIAQDSTLSYDDAAAMIEDARTAALSMFPGKELAYDLIWRPRFQRLMRERFRLM